MDDRRTSETVEREPAPRSQGLFAPGFWRRKASKIAIGVGLLLCAAIGWGVIDASFPVDDIDSERWKRSEARPIAVDAWRRIDLFPGPHDARTGSWIPTPSAPNETREPHLFGGHGSLVSAKFVSAMVPGETYHYTLTARSAGEVMPDAFVAFAREPGTDRRNAEDPSIAARTPVEFHPTFFAAGKRLHVAARYTAQPVDGGRPLYLWLVSRSGKPAAAIAWESHRGTLFPPFDRALGVARVRRGAVDALTGVLGVVGVGLIGSPILFQLWALTLLLVHRRRERLVRGVMPIAAFFLAVTVPPLYELAAFSAISSEEWQGQRGPGTWRYLWTGGRGSLWFLWGAFASAFLGYAAIRGEHMARTGNVVLVLIARSLVSLGFVAGALAATGNSVFAVVPFLAAAVDFAWAERLARISWRRGREEFGASRLVFASAWIFGWVATFVAQYQKARGTYAELPAEMPGGCFVVSAAAKGHPRFVGSRPGLDGLPENDQLATLRGFERVLASKYPELHRPLRCLYNQVGAPIARRLDRRWKADIVYLMLKPLEWAVRLSSR